MAVREAARGLSFGLCNILAWDVPKKGRSVQSVSMCVRIVSEPCQVVSGRVRLHGSVSGSCQSRVRPCQAVSGIFVSGRVRIVSGPCQSASGRVRLPRAPKHSQTPATETFRLCPAPLPAPTPSAASGSPPKSAFCPTPFPVTLESVPRQLQPRR